MAEDLDVEAMLEAPFKKDTYEVYFGLSRLQHYAVSNTDELNGKSRENGDVSKHRYSDSGSKKRASRSRSGSRSRSRTSRRSSPKNGGRRSTSRSRRSASRGKRSQSRGRRSTSRRRSISRKRSTSRSKRSRSRERKRDKDKKRVSSRSPADRKRRPSSRSPPPRIRGRSKERGRGGRSSRSRDRDRGSSSKRRRSRSREPIVRRPSPPLPIPRRRSPTPPPIAKPPFSKRTRSPPGIRSGSPLEELSPEERDARTVFVMQLSQRIRARDLEEFFSSVGKVRDVRMIVCNKTRRFKGIAYIEFKDPESVALALGLSGQKLMGVPIIVQHTQAEKNRMGNSMPTMLPKGMTGPMRLYVGSLHFNITEDMLRGIFEPFGKIENIQLIMDPETGRSKGYGFITFRNCDDAKKALEQLNGFELAGRPMKVGNVTERLDLQQQGPSLLDSDELDRSGIDLGATGRLQLMFKLAEGAGMQVPPAAANALSIATGQPVIVPQVQQQSTPPIATQCFMLSNMFDPATESNKNWDIEIRDDVIEECNKHGGVLHVYVDQGSPQGNVYVKCPSIATAVASVNTLHGRWFAGRVITAAYVPLLNYHSLFPDAMSTTQLLLPSSKK